MSNSIKIIASSTIEQEQLNLVYRDERYTNYDPLTGVLVISDISSVRRRIGDF